MRELLFKGSLVAPLFVGMAVLGFGSTQGDVQLPGREVNSIEASTIKGAACGGFPGDDCANCTGKWSGIMTNGGKSNQANGGGCSSNCTANAAVTASCAS